MQPCSTDPAGAAPLLGQVAEVAEEDVYSECVLFTLVMMVWLSRLNASPTTCMRILSWMGMSRVMRKSTLLKPGPIMLFRPICGGRPVVAPPELELIAPP